MQNGVVKWFDDKRGFGFIESEGKDFFVHFREIQCDGYKSLREGASVSFEPATGDKGAVAKAVRVN